MGPSQNVKILRRPLPAKTQYYFLTTPDHFRQGFFYFLNCCSSPPSSVRLLKQGMEENTMARPKKPKYEHVEKLNLFRKRVKDISGKYVAVYV